MPVIESTAATASASDRHALLPCEVYQSWKAASEDAEEAFLAWCAAAYGHKAEAYAIYRAATDREAAAAAHWLAA